MTIKNARKPGPPGFSAVELLIMLTVMAILAAFSIPALSSAIRDMQLASDVSSISSALTVARIKATTLMTPYQVDFDLDNTSWSLKKWDSTSSDYVVERATNELSRGVTSSGIKFGKNPGDGVPGFPSTSSSAITFNTRGIPIDGSNQPTSDNIIYVSKSDADFAVTVTLTGKVQIWKKNDDGGWTAQ